jgi:hypothetical protein
MKESQMVESDTLDHMTNKTVHMSNGPVSLMLTRCTTPVIVDMH